MGQQKRLLLALCTLCILASLFEPAFGMFVAFIFERTKFMNSKYNNSNSKFQIKKEHHKEGPRLLLLLPLQMGADVGVVGRLRHLHPQLRP